MNMRILSVANFHNSGVGAGESEWIAPHVPDAGRDFMPSDTTSFAASLREMLQNVLYSIRPEVRDAAEVCMYIITVIVLSGIVLTVAANTGELIGSVTAVLLFHLLMKDTGVMITSGIETVTTLSEYTKLLLPVMTSAMAAQGGISASAALYAGTAFFSALLTKLILALMVPGIYAYLALSLSLCVMGEDALKKMADFIRTSITWILKTTLIVFTAYLSITGVVSGTTDAVTIKAARFTISSVVPVVGSILSDASDAVLVSAAVMKNAAGVYGILAALAVCAGPFLKIGIQYLLLKLTGAVCAMVADKRSVDLIERFSAAMSLLLGMTGGSCLIVLISTVCYMKGVG